MRFTIFSRLSAGFIVIFILIILTSIYVAAQFQKLEDIPASILNIDNRMLSSNKKLIDALLSQVRYEEKFIILKDDALYDNFIAARNDFDQYSRELMSVADSPRARSLLNDIKQSHQRYQKLFYKEVESLRTGQRYPPKLYIQEKEKAINTIMEGLKELRTYSENNTYEKLKKLGEAGANARRVALVMLIFFLIFGIAFSTFITRSITKPLAVMRKRTKEIANGNYKSGLKLSSPPEIGELAQDFNSMCNKLKELDKMKSNFFSLMSHELRTPLTSIKEGTTLLLEGLGGETNEKQKRLLRIIEEESNRLIELVISILDLSKMEAGMMTYNFVQADIVPLINKAVVETEPLAKSRNIKAELNISRGLPFANLDIEKILHVLRNLIGNAVKFTPDGGQVRISARLTNGNLEVSVADTGPGIPRENLIIIFDKFKSFNNRNGTGLGLAIVKNIINAHRGKVWAESEPGQGSTFIFVLPV